MKEIKINVPDGKEAVWQENENGKMVLTLVEQQQEADNRPITERIKTFEDACEKLGQAHCYVTEYNMCRQQIHSADLLAYYKLRIICAALNEGWEPQFKNGEYRYYPWFWLYSQKEIDEMSEQDKSDAGMIPTDDYETDYCGFACADSACAPSGTYAYVGSRLCFKNRELALYAGRQFTQLYADFYLIRK